MFNFKNITRCVAAGALVLSVQSHAGGFLGDLVESACGNCGVGRAADKLNHQLGNPVDHAAAAALDAYVPGAGRALEAGWALQRSGAFNQRQHHRNSRPYQGQQNPFSRKCATRYGVGFMQYGQPVGSRCQLGYDIGRTVY